MFRNVTSILILFMSILFLINCSDAPTRKIVKKKNDLRLATQEDREEAKAAKNNIKERRTTSYFYKNNGDIADKGFLVERKIYDDQGRPHEFSRYIGDGSIDLQWSFQYDSDGNLIKKESKNNFGFLRYSGESTYDDLGLEIERKEYQVKSKNYLSVKFNYNEDGLLSETLRYDDEDNVIEKALVFYDTSGNVISKSKFDEFGNEVLKISYEYDGNNIIKIVSESFDKSPRTEMFEYDSLNYLAKHDKGLVIQKFVNDSEGNILEEEIIHPEHGLQQTVKYIYNDAGLLTERIKIDSEGKPALTAKFEYDFY